MLEQMLLVGGERHRDHLRQDMLECPSVRQEQGVPLCDALRQRNKEDCSLVNSWDVLNAFLREK